MKKVLSVMAVSAFVLTANAVFAGGPGKQMDEGCPEACQQQIDDLQSSQAQQNEQLGAHGKQLEDHEGRISVLEGILDGPWYGRVGVRGALMRQEASDGFISGGDLNSDWGFGGALAFGKQMGDFRAELELAYQEADIDEFDNIRLSEGDVKVTTFMANAYYEVPVYDAFAVYGMAGVGVAKYELYATDGIDTLDGSENAFAYKVGAGVTYNFTDDMAADLGYEYLGVADNDLADSINGHNVVASFRYKF